MTQAHRRAAESDVEAMLAVLCEHGVEFVVIGGVAVALQGFVRATKDLDIVPAPGAENAGRLWAALTTLDASPAALGDFQLDELPAPFTLQGLVEGGGNWIVFTRLGRLDLMPYVEDDDGELPYDELRETAESLVLPDTSHRVFYASFDHLIAMKTHAGRHEDLRDVTALRRARGLQDD